MSGYVWGIPRVAGVARRRRRRLWPAVAGSLAAAAGRTLRLARWIATRTPGVAGAVAITFGAWLAWAPAGFLAAGLFLLALDRRMS